MKKKNYARLICGLFCGTLTLAVAANAFTPDQEFSEVENRALAQRPKLTADSFRISWPLRKSGDVFTGEFMSDFETYTTDQFVARDAWVSGKALFEKLTGKQENNGVYFCENSTLITRFVESNITRLDRNLTAVEKFTGVSGVPVTFGLIPTQATVWADRLPAGAPNYDQKQVIDTAYAAAPSAKAADLYTPLMAHRDEPIFYRTDHHWTSLGAYYGYAALGETLGYEPLPLEQYTKTTVSTEFYGTVFSSSGVRWVEPDEMDIYVPEAGITVASYELNPDGTMQPVARELYDESYLSKKDKYSMFLGGNQALCKITTQNTQAPKLLIIRDSYTDSLVPFLTAHFSEIHVMDLRYYKFSPAKYIRQNGIQQALVLYSVPNFVADGNLPFLPQSAE